MGKHHIGTFTCQIFLGDIFRIGFHYHIFGYEVYFGETLLSIAAICLVGILCAKCRKCINRIMVVFALLFIEGFVFCTLWALINHKNGNFSFEPLFLLESSSIEQIARIAVIFPWAIIGLIYFRRLVLNDADRRYRRSLLVWFMLLSLELFASMMWVSEATQRVSNTVMGEVYQHYKATQMPDDMCILSSKAIEFTM